MTREMPGWWWALVALGSVKALAGLPGFVLFAIDGPNSPFPPWVYLTSLIVYISLNHTMFIVTMVAMHVPPAGEEPASNRGVCTPASSD